MVDEVAKEDYSPFFSICLWMILKGGGEISDFKKEIWWGTESHP